MKAKKQLNKISVSNSQVELCILPERVLLYLRKGKDFTVELEKLLREFGVNLTWEFKSPCG